MRRFRVAFEFANYGFLTKSDLLYLLEILHTSMSRVAGHVSVVWRQDNTALKKRISGGELLTFVFDLMGLGLEP